MKDFKYYVIFGISLMAFIYVVIFMPSVTLLEDHSEELWFSDGENITEFYESGIQGIEKMQNVYKGNVKFSDMQMQLNISIGALQSLSSVYNNTQETYSANKVKFYEEFGITNYIEYSMLCDSMKEIFDKNPNDRVLSARALTDTIIDNANGLIFDIQVLYTSGNVQSFVVTFYNHEQEQLESQTSEYTFPTIIKILPKVEG